MKTQNQQSKYLLEANYPGILLDYPGVGNEYFDTLIITEVFYYYTKKQWHVEADHTNQLEGGDRKYFTYESEDVFDIVISRGRGKSNIGMGNHIAEYNNNISCPGISMKNIATIYAAPRVGGGLGVDATIIY